MTVAGPARHHPDRVRRLEWHEPGVTMPEVVSELTRMHATLGRHGRDPGDDSHPHPRNCVMNLVAVVPDAAAVDRVERVGRDLSAQHPLRLLTLQLEEAHNVDRLDAWISTEAHELPGGMPIQPEMVRLHVTGTGAAEVETLVEPLLVSDVPVFLWWLGTPPTSAASFRRLLELVEVLMVDSASFERPFVTTLELADVAPTIESGIILADLQWARLHAWRELLAQVFTPLERQAFLHGIGAVGVDYVGEGRGNRVAAALLTGWVASRLGWRLVRAAAGQGGIVVAHYEHRGRPLEVAFRSVEASELAEGEVSAIRVEASARATTFDLELVRDPERRSRVHTRLRIGELEALEEWRPIDTPAEAELLVELVVQRRDAVYAEALEQAAELLRAFR